MFSPQLRAAHDGGKQVSESIGGSAMRFIGLLTSAAMLSACAATPYPVRAVGADARTAPVSPPPAMQYLYGSGEATALSRQAYTGLANFVAGVMGRGGSRSSVVLSRDARLDAPTFADCGDKPPAVVLDTDETAILNVGFEADQASRGGAFDAGRWSRWEQTGTAVVPVPGALAAVKAIRSMGVAVVFNSNRSATNAAATDRLLDGLGFGPAVHHDTLFLAGDDATGPAKDGRRAMIAARYCVIAMSGDQLGDFSDLFNAIADPALRRTAADAKPLAWLWGNGWFMLPNPVYGPGIRGDLDTVFPPTLRWRDPAEPR